MRIAIVGASGAVGQEFLRILEQRALPIDELLLFGSERSAGRTYRFRGRELTVKLLQHNDDFRGVDFALVSAGAGTSREFAETITRHGTVMIDNSSAFRMDEEGPLVVPEVNPQDVAWHNGVIANPNCSTIQMVVALKPLYDLSPIRRVVVSTYQAASGAGAPAMAELYDQTREFLDGKPEEELTIEAFAHRIAFNTIPHIDVFLEDGSTKEEWKMVVETKKIMGDPAIEVAATCVRVPVLRCHGEAVNVEFADEVTVDEARAALEAAPGIVVMDDTANKVYPMPGLLAGTDGTFVGRLRKDPTVPHGIAFWNVADQIRKGAALNAVQIAQLLLPN